MTMGSRVKPRNSVLELPSAVVRRKSVPSRLARGGRTASPSCRLVAASSGSLGPSIRAVTISRRTALDAGAVGAGLPSGRLPRAKSKARAIRCCGDSLHDGERFGRPRASLGRHRFSPDHGGRQLQHDCSCGFTRDPIVIEQRANNA